MPTRAKRREAVGQSRSALVPGPATGLFGPVTDKGDGSYSATFTAGTKGTNTITATLDGFAIMTAAPVTVTLNSYVEVASNPTSQVASAGNPVSFVAAGAGTPTPTVQWQVSTDGGNTFSNVAGATSTMLTFETTAVQNSDEYRTVFTNSSGTATTAPATFTVNTQPGGLVISATKGVFPQFSLQQPPQGGGSVGFGLNVVALSTGNIVVAADDPPVAYLYNGHTGTLISVLTGTGVLGFTVTALTNGNYVLAGWSQGWATATWANGMTGISGTVSATNSLVAGGDVSSDFKVTPLANGNYVADFVGWDGNMGAVTWGNGTTGTVGTVSAANSLVGSTFGDSVGRNGSYTVVSTINYTSNELTYRIESGGSWTEPARW